ncbi:hypothetical protein SAMN05421636_106118 [Pricia antarctica]|uniref:Lipoprotein n=1 Tax=Pricia antarctica TaxID=641691 RepID=A0A1G7EB80_9FLAO|nr:hypothetical protein [Pricia antarctica]SDE60974.1 hypothetical protein SAMN05421636_106118 [Pricia antarctica]
MKTGSRIIAAIIVLFSVACGAKKSTQSKMEKNQNEMVAEGTDESQVGAMGDDSVENTGEMDDATSSVQMANGSGGGNSNVNIDAASTTTVTDKSDNTQMYQELRMTDDQIQSFENAIKDFTTQQQNTASGEMMGTLSDEKDRQLEEILSKEQYSAYESWKQDN